VFDPTYAGLGYATEGAAMIVELAFSDWRASREWALDARNTASARVLEKLGMRREATSSRMNMSRASGPTNWSTRSGPGVASHARSGHGV